MLGLGLALARRPSSTSWGMGRCCPSALLEWQSSSRSPSQSEAKLQAREMPSSELDNSSARQRKKSGIKSVLAASPLIDGEPGALASRRSGFGGV